MIACLEIIVSVIMLAEECKAGPKKTGPKIKLYVDIVSPFAYMAYYTLRVSACLQCDTEMEGTTNNHKELPHL